MATAELTRRGWHIKEESLETLLGEEKCTADAVVKRALNTDLRDIGASWLDEDINRSKLDYVVGPAVLQLQKLRVVSAPKENEESQTAPKLCRLSLTDGHVTCSAVTLEPIKGIGVNTAPGTKVLLTGTIEVETSFLLLSSNNFSSLGGRVESLSEPWELKKTLAKQSLTRARGEGGPPPFVPFGKKIGKNPPPSLHKDNFKSLAAPKDKKTSEGDSEFEQQRQAEIKQALQAKSTSGGVKTFGGGNKAQINDKDVARITEMGFSAEEATSALRTSAGNVQEAINLLLSGGSRNQRVGGRGPGRGGGGGGEGGRRGRRERDRDYDDDGEGPINTKPSGPATLFDFLETKFPTKGGAKTTPLSNLKSANPATNTSFRAPSTPTDKLYDEPYKPNSQHHTQKFGQDSTSQRCSYRDGIQRNRDHYSGGGGGGTASNNTQYQSQKSGQDSSSQHCSYRDGVRKDRDQHSGGGGAAGSYNKQNNFDNSRGGRGYSQQQQSDVPPRFAKSGQQQQRGGGQNIRDRTDPGQYSGDQEQGAHNRGTGRYGRGGHRGGGGDGRYNSAGDQYRHDREGPGGYRAGGGKTETNNSTYPSPRPGAYPQHRPPLSENSPLGSNAHRERQENSLSNRPKSSTYNPDENRNNVGRSQGEMYSSENSYSEGYRHDQRTNSKQSEDNQSRRGGYPDHNRTDGQARQEPVPSGNRNSSQNFGGKGSQHYHDNRGGGQPPRFSKWQENSDRGRHYNQHQQGHQGPLLSNPYKDGSYNNHQMMSHNDSPGVSIGDTVMAKYWEDGKLYPAVIENVHQAGSTVVVTFIEYGNQEEVLMEDLMPIQQQGWTYQMPPHMYGMGGIDPTMQDQGFSSGPAFVPPMEFTRGGGNYQGGAGGGGARRRPESDRRKPTQKYYVAPNQKS